MSSLWRRPFAPLTNWWNSSARSRLAILSASLLLLLVVLGVVSLYTQNVSIRSEVDQRNDELASMAARDIDGELKNTWSILRLVTRQVQASAPELPGEARALLDCRVSYPLTFRALYLLNARGDVVVQMADPLDQLLAVEDLSDIVGTAPTPPTKEITEAFRGAVKDQQYLSAVRIVGADQLPVMHMGLPALVEQGHVTQVLVAEIDLRYIWRRVDEIQVGQTGRAFVSSREGIIIAHPDRSYMGRLLPPVLQASLEGYEGHARYHDVVTGATMMASYSPVSKQSGWAVVVEQEAAEAFAPINRMIAVIVTALLLGCAIVALLLRSLARSIIEPIRHLAQVTKAISVTGDLEHSIPVASRDEVGQLGVAFNLMIARLKRAGQSLAERAEQMSLLARRVEEVREDERRDLARELHDTAGQAITAIRLDISRMKRRTEQGNPSPTAQELGLLIDLVDRTGEDVRRISSELRPGVLDDIGLDGAIQWQVDEMRKRTDIHFTVDLPSEELWLDEPRRTTLFRVLQELLTNVVRHAEAHAVHISLTNSGKVCTLTVSDDGRGMGSAGRETARSLGVMGMRERLLPYGGTLHYESTPRKGTTARVVIPVA